MTKGRFAKPSYTSNEKRPVRSYRQASPSPARHRPGARSARRQRWLCDFTAKQPLRRPGINHWDGIGVRHGQAPTYGLRAEVDASHEYADRYHGGPPNNRGARLTGGDSHVVSLFVRFLEMPQHTHPRRPKRTQTHRSRSRGRSRLHSEEITHGTAKGLGATEAQYPLPAALREPGRGRGRSSPVLQS